MIINFSCHQCRPEVFSDENGKATLTIHMPTRVALSLYLSYSKDVKEHHIFEK